MRPLQPARCQVQHRAPNYRLSRLSPVVRVFLRLRNFRFSASTLAPACSGSCLLSKTRGHERTTARSRSQADGVFGAAARKTYILFMRSRSNSVMTMGFAPPEPHFAVGRRKPHLSCGIAKFSGGSEQFLALYSYSQRGPSGKVSM